MKAYSALFQNRNFLFHWMAGAISYIGDFFNSLALVKILSEDPAHLGFYMSLIMVSKVLPSALLSPVAGALADRLPRRAIMITSDLIRAALVLALVFVEQPALILTLVFLSAIASVFYFPASSAMLPGLVKKEELVTAGSLGVMTQRMAMLLGNGLGAAVLIAVGPHNVFYIDSASFLVSALLLSFISVPAAARAAASSRSAWGKFVEDMRETLAFLKQASAVRHLMTSLSIASIGDSAINILMVTFFTITLGIAAEMVGFVWALFGATSVIGALVIGAIGNRVHWRHLFTFGAAYVWFTMVGALVTSSVIPSTAFLTLLGLGSGATNVALQAAIGELVPDHVRGRVFGAWSTVQAVLFVSGGLTAGALSDRIGPAPTLLLFSMAFLACALYAFFAFRKLPSRQSAPAAPAVGD
ncbi:MAG: MFS transporter [Bacillota bacterium]